MEDPEAPCGSTCPHVSLLVQVTDDGRVADNFRVVLSSTRIHAARFRGADIFTHKQFHPFSFTYETSPAEIEFPVGKTAGGQRGEVGILGQNAGRPEQPWSGLPGGVGEAFK